MDERAKRGSPDRMGQEFYREEIFEMVGKIYDVKLLKMAYGFIKRLYKVSKQ